MKHRTLEKVWIGCCLLLAAGCGGGIPEVLVNAARSKAKQAVEELVDEVFDQVTGDLLDPDNFPLPFDLGSGGE